MTSQQDTQAIFFSLLRAGLWEQACQPAPEATEWRAVFRLAGEQSVMGLVAAGLEHMTGSVPKADLHPFLMRVLALEETNVRMDRFIAELMERLRAQGIKACLVKGQGIAQCYERPLIGSIAPGLPGPPLSWVGLLLIYIWGGGTDGAGNAWRIKR